MYDRPINESKISRLQLRIVPKYIIQEKNAPPAHQISKTPNGTAELKSRAGALRESFAFKLAEQRFDVTCNSTTNVGSGWK